MVIGSVEEAVDAIVGYKAQKGNKVDSMEGDSSDGPETMPSNTKTAAATAAAKAAKAGQYSDASRRNGSRMSDSDDDDGDADGSDDSNSGKRKADDFLRRQELAMDPRFKAKVVLPGDDVTESTTRTTKTLRLGPGLVQHAQDKVLATRAGVLRYRPPCSYWVESNGRRYSARAEDQVLGVVEDRMGDWYKVNVFGRCEPACRGCCVAGGCVLVSPMLVCCYLVSACGYSSGDGLPSTKRGFV